MVSIAAKIPIINSLPIISDLLNEMDEGRESNINTIRPGPKSVIPFGNDTKEESCYNQDWKTHNNPIKGEIVFSSEKIPRILFDKNILRNEFQYDEQLCLYARAITHSSLSNYPLGSKKFGGEAIYLKSIGDKHWCDLIWDVTIDGQRIMFDNKNQHFFVRELGVQSVTDEDGFDLYTQSQSFLLKLVLNENSAPKGSRHHNRTHCAFTSELLRCGVGIHSIQVKLLFRINYKGKVSATSQAEPIFGTPLSHPIAQGSFQIEVLPSQPMNIWTSPIPKLDDQYSTDLEMVLEALRKSPYYGRAQKPKYPLSAVVTTDWSALDWIVTRDGKQKCQGWGLIMDLYCYMSPQNGHERELISVSSIKVCNTILGKGYAGGFGTLETDDFPISFSTSMVPDIDLQKVPNRCPRELRKWNIAYPPLQTYQFGKHCLKTKTLNLDEFSVTLSLNSLTFQIHSKEFQVRPLPQYSNPLKSSQAGSKAFQMLSTRVTKLGYNRYGGGITWSDRHLQLDGQTLTWNTPPQGQTQLTPEHQVRLVYQNNCKRANTHPGGNPNFYDYAVGRENCIEITHPIITYYIQFKSQEEAYQWCKAIEYNILLIANTMVNNSEQVKSLILECARNSQIDTQPLESVNWQSLLDSLYFA
ncbi:hypothetical protein DLAC_04818 [Tieghemostelium lacteum]|uniref:PH domain-containing protein n=1 Tax=Tieghemostelium lacteum TaxID=361077 RepID=A0A151ZIV7_TIELA|nr:hypothetical protein DLAC_04818 [Tieghemostelium lacteum]|eukprot:KYQ93931.1 hypothetical protein DLAC_04818 [Tieghemostelium lacteum]